jgi:hypothetical protein
MNPSIAHSGTHFRMIFIQHHKTGTEILSRETDRTGPYVSLQFLREHYSPLQGGTRSTSKDPFTFEGTHRFICVSAL